MGLSRDADIIPDFEQYEKIYTAYYPIINSVFDKEYVACKCRAQPEESRSAARDFKFAGMVQALGDDLKAATIGKDISMKENARAKDRVEKITQKIKDKKEELENASVDNIRGCYWYRRARCRFSNRHSLKRHQPFCCI